jgi:hypothetical protein
MKYIADTMLNGLEKPMKNAKIILVTAHQALRNTNDSRISIPDGEIFRFVLEKKYNLVPRIDVENWTILTSDKELLKYCETFQLNCIYIEKPSTPKEFDDVAEKLAKEIKESR